MLRKHTTLSLIAVLLFVSLGFKCGGTPDQIALKERVVRAISAVPTVVRELFPNADTKVLASVDAAAAAFVAFSNNQTGSNWERAEQAWGSAKPLLRTLGNDRIRMIIAAVDILLGQVSVVAPPEGAKGVVLVVTEFKADDVKELERLVKEK
jgi:hypothetical protein